MWNTFADLLETHHGSGKPKRDMNMQMLVVQWKARTLWNTCLFIKLCCDAFVYCGWLCECLHKLLLVFQVHAGSAWSRNSVCFIRVSCSPNFLGGELPRNLYYVPGCVTNGKKTSIQQETRLPTACCDDFGWGQPRQKTSCGKHD